MTALWIHKKVYLAWSKWIAFQFARQWDEMSLGVRVNWRRPLIDIYCGPMTLAIGRHAVYTDPRTRTWDGCRGFIMPDNPQFPFAGDTVEARIL